MADVRDRTQFNMSPTSRLSVNLAVTRIVDHTLPEDSTDGDESGSIFESRITDEDTICLRDLLNCPEFMEEQKVILLEFETARLRIEDERETPPQRQKLDGRSRRGSIGIKLTCPICLESLTSTSSSYVRMVTECGHVFCQPCIENVCEAAKEVRNRSSDGKALCPVCREEVGELRKVYF